MGKTIEFYRGLETEQLRNLLNSFETAQSNTKHIISEFTKRKRSTEKFEGRMLDYDIDVHLIRMELNKRLWKE